MKRILIVGGSSMLGYKISSISKNYEIYYTFYRNKIFSDKNNSIKINICDKKECEKIVELKPDVIINCAALTNVDYCEKFKDEAYEVNVNGTKNLVEICNKINSKFVHISSDAIFSGNKGCFVEEDTPKAVNVYGKTKLESEKIASLVSNHLILRSSVIFGWIPLQYLTTRDKSIKKMNFALWVIKNLYEGKKIFVVNDQFNTPTLVDNLANNIIELIDKDLTGIFHVGGQSCISRLDFSRKLAEEFGYPTNLIHPIKTKELNQNALRATNSCLNCQKSLQAGMKILKIDEGIKIMAKQIKIENPQLFNN